MQPSTSDERSRNPLRPNRLSQIVGQAPAKNLMTRAIASCHERVKPLDHTLLIGPSGTGKTTLATCIANELGVECYQMAAPMRMDQLLELRETMRHGEILFVDEIHLQAVRERRGKDSASEPEVWFSLLEDRVLMTGHGPLPFPLITVMGATTDPGMLPEPFLNRFPLQPQLGDYSLEEMRTIIRQNAEVLEVRLQSEAIDVFARASRGVPRQANSLVRNAASLLTMTEVCDKAKARELLCLLGIEHDGLTRHMSDTLRFLFTSARRVRGDGEVIFQASVNSIATAIGLSRDTKAVALYVEPFLIKSGLLQVAPSGRLLTEAGVRRAKELLP